MLIMRDSSLIPSRFPGNMAPPPQLRTQLSQVHCPWEITCNLLNTWNWNSSFLSQDCIFKEFTVGFQGLIKITKRLPVHLKMHHEENPLFFKIQYFKKSILIHFPEILIFLSLFLACMLLSHKPMASLHYFSLPLCLRSFINSSPSFPLRFFLIFLFQ